MSNRRTVAMVAQAPRASRQPASSLTPIATVRRLDMLAPTGDGVSQVSLLRRAGAGRSSSSTLATSTAIFSLGNGPAMRSPLALSTHHWPSLDLLIRNPLTLFAADIYLPRWLVESRHDSVKRPHPPPANSRRRRDFLLCLMALQQLRGTIRWNISLCWHRLASAGHCKVHAA